jgi:undecaprenyl pyrophosphate phosphatase UppP
MKSVLDKLAWAVDSIVPFIIVLFALAQLVHLVRVNEYLAYAVYLVLGGLMAAGVVWVQFLRKD